MHTDQYVAGILAGAATLILAGMAFVMMTKASTDLLRENLFERRRQLFLLVADGRVDPRSTQYVRIRSMINGLLRHAEEMSIWFLLATYLALRKLPPASTSLEETVMQVRDEQTRSELRRALSGVTMDLLCHSMRTSPLLWLALLGTPIVLLVLGLFRAIRRLPASAIDILRKPVLNRIARVSERFSDDENDLQTA